MGGGFKTQIEVNSKHKNSNKRIVQDAKQRLQQKKLESQIEQLNNFDLGLSSDTNTVQTSNIDYIEQMSKILLNSINIFNIFKFSLGIHQFIPCGRVQSVMSKHRPTKDQSAIKREEYTAKTSLIHTPKNKDSSSTWDNMVLKTARIKPNLNHRK